MKMPVHLPSIELSVALLEEPELLAAKFLGRFSVSDAAELENILLQEKNRAGKGEIDGGIILQGSAFLGEYVRMTLGGVWEWDEQKQTVGVTKIGGKKRLRLYPLFVVSRFCQNPRFYQYSINSIYNAMKHVSSV